MKILPIQSALVHLPALALTLALAALHLTSAAQTSLEYSLSFPEYMHHEAQVRLTVHHAPGGPLTFRMSRSSPGRYATHEFGKNVYQVNAVDGQGHPLEVRQTDGDIYQVPVHGGELTLQYTLFGNFSDGTYVGIDRSHAHLNMPGTIMWLAGQDEAPIKISFHVPDNLGWKVATQLAPTGDPFTFTAPGLQYLMDCPTELSDFRMSAFEETNPDGKKLTFRVALHAYISEDLWQAFVQDVKAIVEEERKVFGEFASFDYGTYTFIIDAHAWDNHDGMEHRNSTCITIPMDRFTEEELPGALDVVAHEFFHSWNVKRIRPRTIEPFDFTKSNMSDELWVAEGFTQYYGLLTLARAGFTPRSQEITLLGRYLNALVQNPGSRYYTPIQSSRLAIFTDAGVSIDKNNFSNTFLSYYIYGANIAFILDLHLRKDYNKTLDDFMKAMWTRYGKTARWYNVKDLENTLGAITSPAYAKTFFDNYVYSTRRDDWTPYFASEGLRVVNEARGTASWGNVSYRMDDSSRVVIDGGAVKGTPLYDGGLDAGDAILSLDGQPVHQSSDVTGYLSGLLPGKIVTVEYFGRGARGTVKVTLAEGKQIGLQQVDEQNKARQAWLGPQY
jgi:predicted metalloprotease with PDZ domain